MQTLTPYFCIQRGNLLNDKWKCKKEKKEKKTRKVKDGKRCTMGEIFAKLVPKGFYLKQINNYYTSMTRNSGKKKICRQEIGQTFHQRRYMDSK